MASRAGRDFRVLVFIAGQWENLPGERSTRLIIQNEEVESSGKASPWRELTRCGVRFAESFAAGVMRDDLTRSVWNAICSASFTGDPLQVRVESGADILAEGAYQIVALTRSGEHNDGERYEVAFQSAAALDFVESVDLITEGGLLILVESGADNLQVEG